MLPTTRIQANFGLSFRYCQAYFAYFWSPVIMRPQSLNDFIRVGRDYDIILHVLVLLVGIFQAVDAPYVGAVTVTYSSVYIWHIAVSADQPRGTRVTLASLFIAVVLLQVTAIVVTIKEAAVLSVGPIVIQSTFYFLMTLIPFSFKYRHQLDSMCITAHREDSNSILSEITHCHYMTLLSSSRYPGGGLQDRPMAYSIARITWWQERDLFMHEFLTVEAVLNGPRPSTIFIRAQRGKWEWLKLGRRSNLMQHLDVSDNVSSLTKNSVPIAEYAVEVDYARWAGHNLQLFGELIQCLESERPRYSFPANCWWFSRFCFSTLVHSLPQDKLTAYRWLTPWCRQPMPDCELSCLKETHEDWKADRYAAIFLMIYVMMVEVCILLGTAVFAIVLIVMTVVVTFLLCWPVTPFPVELPPQLLAKPWKTKRAILSLLSMIVYFGGLLAPAYLFMLFHQES